MISDKEIKNLIECSKQIYKREPKNRYRKEKGQTRADLFLHSEKNTQDLLKGLKTQETEDLRNNIVSKKLKFKVFIRQNETFIENFSIGLVCSFSGFPNTLNLIRYNGLHDSKTGSKHHLKPHIHEITAKDVTSNNLNPKPTKLEITNKYNTLEEGLLAFFEDIKIKNWPEYFPELNQGSLF